MEGYSCYLEKLEEILREMAQQEGEAIRKAAALIYHRVKNGGFLYVFGTGHGHMLAEELFYRAGGMVRVIPMLDEQAMLHISASGSTAYEREIGNASDILSRYALNEKDILLIASNSGRNAVPVEIALLSSQKGAATIALTNLKHSESVPSRHPGGKKLYEVCDVVIDNHGVPGDACVHIGGKWISPTSTAVGAAILQALVAQVAYLAQEDGAELEFFVSSNMPDGDMANQSHLTKYCGIIKAL